MDGNNISEGAGDDERQGDSSCGSVCSRWVRKYMLAVATAVAVILGLAVGIGVALSGATVSLEVQLWVKIWGELYLRLLDCVILFLVPALIIIGISGLGDNSATRLSVVSCLWLFSVQIISVLLGICLVAGILTSPTPGTNVSQADATGSDTSTSTTLIDLLKNMVPRNIFQSLTQSTKTVITPSNVSREGEEATEIQVDGPNMIGLVLFSVFVGVSMRASREVCQPLVNILLAIRTIGFYIINASFWYSPIAVFSLVVSAFISTDASLDDILSLAAAYLGALYLGLALMALLIMPLALFLTTRLNPYKVMWQFGTPYVTGIAPPSSAASLPGLIRVCEDNFNIRSEYTTFAVPFFNTLAKAGSTLFLAASIIFLARLESVSLSLGSYMLISITTLVLSFTVPPVPSGSILILILLGNTVGIPVDRGVGILFALEWLSNRLRTAVNITSMGFGCLIVSHTCTGINKEEHQPGIKESLKHHAHNNSNYQTIDDA